MERRNARDVAGFPNKSEVAAVCRMMRALSSPIRLDLLALLADGPQSVGALAEQLNVPVPTASRHLGMLRRAELVDNRADGSHRIQALSVNVEISRSPSGVAIRVCDGGASVLISLPSGTNAENASSHENARTSDTSAIQVRVSEIARAVRTRKLVPARGMRERG